GSSYEEIIDKIYSYTNQTEMYLLPESMNQLKNSGRVSTPQAIFASLLHINLLLGFDQGKVVVVDKIRTKRKAKQRLFRKIANAVNTHQLKEICVMHSGVKEKAVQWKGELEEVHQQLKVKIETLVPVAGVHTCYGTMAVCWLYSYNIFNRLEGLIAARCFCIKHGILYIFEVVYSICVKYYSRINSSTRFAGLHSMILNRWMIRLAVLHLSISSFIESMDTPHRYTTSDYTIY